MSIHFQIKPLKSDAFNAFFQLSPDELAKKGAVRMVVDKHPGFPCRVSLQDAEVGEEVLLVSYTHHATDSPYRSSGAIFVRVNATEAKLDRDEIPLLLDQRMLSLRGYDAQGMMKHAQVCAGRDLRSALLTVFEDRQIDYIHIHNAKPGCYNCRVERA